MRFYFSLFICFFIFFPKNASCSNFIEKIEIKGNQRVSNDFILSHSKLKKNYRYSNIDFGLVLKRILSTGYFENVYLNKIKKVLFITLKENPIVNQVFLNDSNILPNNFIKEKLLTKPFSNYKFNNIKKDLTKIKKIYKNKGFFSISITPKIIYKNKNSIDIVYQIKKKISHL